MNYQNDSLNSEEESYFSRNKRWLFPLLAGFILTATPAVLEVLQQPVMLPSAVTTGVGMLCALAVGFGAMRTDTTSGEIVARLGFVAGLVIAGVAVLKHFS
jgi:hypothetical protein